MYVMADPAHPARPVDRRARWGRAGRALVAHLPRLAREGAEDRVPVRGAYAEAGRVVLEVVAHVQLAQALAHVRLRLVVVQEVVGHVVDQVARQETGPERVPVRGSEHGPEADAEQRR